jgi:hypothetical protein
MPFTTTTALPANPDVRIFFSGLMLIKPDGNAGACEVFVNGRARFHELTIEVREKRPGRPDLIKMRHVGTLPYAEPPLGAPPLAALIHGMTILVDNSPKGVRSYDGTTASTEGQSLNLAINLQDPQFQNGRAGQPEPLGGRPSIFLNDAVFYTAQLTDPRVTINLRKRTDPNTVPPLATLAPFASLIGANIYLDAGAKLVMRWKPNGNPRQLELKKPDPAEPDDPASYEIYIVNDPLFENESGEPPHEELGEYYHLLPQVPDADKLRLEVIPPGPAAAVHRGSTKTPCMSCILDP